MQLWMKGGYGREAAIVLMEKTFDAILQVFLLGGKIMNPNRYRA